MANEFIARKGLIVLNNGAKITGSLGVLGDINATGYNVTASNLQLLGSASIDGDITIAGNLTVGNADVDVIKFLAEVSSSILPDVNNAFDLGSGSKSWRDLYVSGTAYIGTVDANTINLDNITVLDDLTVQGNTILGDSSADSVKITGSFFTSGSNTFVGPQTINGNIVLDNSSQIRLTDNTDSTLFGFYDGTSILGAYYQMWGNNHASTSQRGSAEFVYDIRNNAGANFHVASYDGSTWTQKFLVNDNGIQVTGSANISGQVVAPSFSGSFSGSGAQVFGIPNSGLVNSTIGITAGSGLSGGATVSLGGSTTVSLDTSSAHFITGSTQAMDLRGVFSSSVQTDVRQTTGIATIATTGSNTFTGIQTISNTTNSTNYLDGALVVAGGVGIARDVNISGSLTITGLLTAVSTSIQYVTSSQLLVADNQIIINTTNALRYGGVSVVDSGSATPLTGSLYWDSFYNRWIVENVEDETITSGIILLGPENTGATGTEASLVENRVPIATEGNHLDNRLESSSIRIDFPTRLTHIEAGLYVTGAVTSSVGFSGDGSQLTGIVTNLNLTGSEGGTGTVALKTQGLILSGSNGVAVTVTGQTVTISGSNATTTVRGVAAFTGSNFAVNGGIVSSNPINFNGADINLGGTHSFGLQNITPYGASTSDQVTFSGGAIISTVLYSSATDVDVDTGTEVVATVSTGSYDAAFFDYVVKKGSNYRAGTVMTVWESGTTNVEFTDTSTNDLGNTTDIVFTVDLVSATARLKATAASNDWSIKTAIRAF